MVWDPSKWHGGEAAASRAFDRSNPSRYAAKAGRASAPPKHFTRTDKTPDTTAASKRAHAESDRRVPYNEAGQKGVVAKTERTARG
jgi:hypothetical protein